ncbi:DUF2799 domain-containing protein [Aliivibrio sp. S4TY2]|uniref:DUF2799 domain-containing protein n=1 Tax=unclassified Aliivibrio TaxID=2645654 RepID=UPI002378EE73|nr:MULTISPECIES: DUF2799 domain-containing protein [unclassified Aliivibrio]MDD9154817.1 DUF2799 domain-containing protein [Aliivibrio sp. S4TY2]MDD9158820.1 DUF2799 domain-containing protein [Aliivibrio sp. S4TY1]MDD9162820.1 DUF2799 domain-containing protein [Aliivibrio sp. S4MY2]MDD9166819.1 DUF2799 domain-containing protein [Aliivibrio sp. S4MY4]MDD9183897.1 DUF2799 domain-containing protein [Aliivibrio sp. S4MY3]
MKEMIVILSILLTSCATVPTTPKEYWFGQGERFGSRGYSIETDALESMKEKVPFDEVAYLEGYKKGINIYCDPFQAFSKGVSGIRYTGQCDSQKEVIMIKAEWERGWQSFIAWDFGIR